MSGTIRKLRYWVQSVIPIAYTNSLSYYETIDKLINYVNNLITDCQTLADDIEALEERVKALEEKDGG